MYTDSPEPEILDKLTAVFIKVKLFIVSFLLVDVYKTSDLYVCSRFIQRFRRAYSKVQFMGNIAYLVAFLYDI